MGLSSRGSLTAVSSAFLIFAFWLLLSRSVNFLIWLTS